MSLANHRGRTIGGDEVTEQKAVVENRPGEVPAA